MPTLPDRTFDEIAVELLGAAGGAREAVNAAEMLDARGLAGPGLKHTRASLELRAEILGGLYSFFRAAAGHEALIRDFLAGIEAVPVAAPDKRRRAS